MYVIEEKRVQFPNVYYRVCPFSVFIMEIPRKPEVPKSRIMSDDEVKAHLEEQMKTKRDMNTIDGNSDAIITWLGARKGQFIEQLLLSRNAAFFPSVRKVI